MTEFNHYYTNHIAEKIELDTLTIIDYHDPQKGYEYNLRFIFDKKNSTFAITGDFGELTARNFYNMGDWENFYSDYTNDLGYFLEKVTSSSRPIYSYDIEKAKNKVLNTFFEVDNEDELVTDDWFIFYDLFNNFDDEIGFSHIPSEFIERFNIDFDEHEIYENLRLAGQYVNAVFRLYLDAYKRAYEYLTKEVDDGTTQNV
ncbi:TPA: hypothetical protein ACI0DN_000917 [Streptococcus agalactiae]|uniref:hypothetical protein n=1 Tax=Streptococcus agalactiae TaxID=1311 RepID=UPI0002BA1978|nr:hypothetical protein [Streptococcus agalactiae]HEP3595836.1 hypothetical protein [Streptococcus pyogenes]EPT97923.1 hypothetical protein SAG0108_05950 [Streptococcus agalactiae BSU92]CND60542.1 Uncharacterised protein [Streptococcus agalactiae]CNI02390.1 Uncharacterised protein [Streptococcus agalactiae]HEN5990776.1 hypothetical protein [Streptococcus agalactiae]